MLSAYFSVKHAAGIGVWCPTVDSCDLRVFATYEETNPKSENFFELIDPNLTDPSKTKYYNNPFVWNIGTGKKAFQLDRFMHNFPNNKIQLGVPQTETRTLFIITHTQ